MVIRSVKGTVHFENAQTAGSSLVLLVMLLPPHSHQVSSVPVPFMPPLTPLPAGRVTHVGLLDLGLCW